GAALAFLVSAGPPRVLGRTQAVGRGLSAVGLLALIAAAPHVPAYAFGVTLLAAIATAFMILDVLTGHSWIVRLLETRALVRTGGISYGLYLWHLPVFHYLGVLKQPGEHAPYAYVALAWGVTFAVALASYFLVERPALAYKARFKPSRRAPQAGA